MSSLRIPALRGALLASRWRRPSRPWPTTRRPPRAPSTGFKGLGNEAIGSAKRGVGNLTDDEQLKAEGRNQKLRGQAQQEKGKAKDTIENAIDK